MKNTIALFLMGFMVMSCGQQQKSDPGAKFGRTSAEVVLSSNGFPMNYGVDVCAQSGGLIETVRHGGRLVLDNGTDLRFNSSENLAKYYLNIQNRDEIASIEVVDFAHGRKMLPVNELIYLRSANRPSPGGYNITPIDNTNERMKRNIYDAYPGEFLSWNELLETVKGDL